MSAIKVTPANIKKFQDIIWNKESAQYIDRGVEESGQRYAVIYDFNSKKSIYITDVGGLTYKMMGDQAKVSFFPRYEVSVYDTHSWNGRCHCFGWDTDVMDFLRQNNIGG